MLRMEWLEKLETIELDESIVMEHDKCFNKKFHAKVFTLFASAESQLYTFPNEFSPNAKYNFVFQEKEMADCYIDYNGLLKIRKWILDKCEDDITPVLELYDRWRKYWQEYTVFLENLWEKDLKKLSDDEYYELFWHLYEKYQNAGGLAYICDSFMCKEEKDWLSEKLKKGGVNNPEKFIDMGYESFGLRSDRALIEIKNKIGEKKFDELEDEELALLKKHSRDFYWINNNYYNVEFLDEKYFFDRIKEIDPKHDDKNPLGIPEGGKFELNLINISRMFTVWKDVRKSGVYMGMHWFDVFLGEFARRTGYLKEDMTYIHFYEVKDILFEKKDMAEEIKRRKEICFYAFTKNGYFLASGDDARDLKKLMENKIELSEEISGVSAYKGKSRGKVKVVFTTKDMKDIKDGDVLVTNQTTPEFVTVMKKVSAIVTEQGGLTSHAAVISRELRIPCIIGVSDATKILKDDDQVEIDSDKGIIRKI